MSRRYITAYAAWLAGVLTMAAVALVWYRHVEGIGWSELGTRAMTPPDTDDDSGDIEAE